MKQASRSLGAMLQKQHEVGFEQGFRQLRNFVVRQEHAVSTLCNSTAMSANVLALSLIHI